uniref:Uncharacterized protein n=1 Tax=Anopheles quadriannulatus TaxID=34691 RepID=A0A182XQB7_ANOQN
MWSLCPRAFVLCSPFSVLKC